jgi:choline dehydrogenase-like flavoprotein
MIVKTEHLRDGCVINPDICVIGSGIAALTLVAELLKERNGPKIALLESAREEPSIPAPVGKARRSIGRSYRKLSSDVQHLYAGSASGWIGRSKPDYLTESRLRTAGGTSWVWSGWWWPLEPHDFSTTETSPAVRWPIQYADVHPYYLRAHERYALGPFAYDDLPFWETRLARPSLIPLPEYGNLPLRSRVLLFKRVNPWPGMKARIHRSKQIDMYLNANVVELEYTTAASGQPRFTNVVARSIENRRPGRSLNIHARIVVIAAGSLESTRLLLAAGMQSRLKELGRNFIEHPYMWNAARFMPADIDAGIRHFYMPEVPIRAGAGVGAIAALVPKAQFLRRQGIGSFRLLLGGASAAPGTVNACWGQFPDPRNQVMLSSDEVDLFGMRRIRVEACLTDIDLKTVKQMVWASREAIRRWRLGRSFHGPHGHWMRATDEEPGRITPGNHPMGVTRMSDSPRNGVVDRYLRLHGMENGYVVSTGVFPGAGYANPMLTLVALAIRLADHLRATFASSTRWT